MKSLKTILSYSFVMFLLLGTAEITQAQDEARVQAIELYNNAQELAGSDEFDGAIDLYRDALEIARDNGLNDITDLIEERLPRVYGSRASNSYRTYQNERTVASIDRAIEDFQESQEAAAEFDNQQVEQQARGAIPQLYYVRSILNFRQDNLEEAMSDLDTAIELNSNYAAAYYQKGIVQKRMTPENVDAWMQWYDRAISIAEQVGDNTTLDNATEGAAEELIYRGVTLGEEREFDRAIELLNMVEQYDPSSDEQHYRLSEIYNKRGNWSAAETHARQSLDFHTGGVADKAKIYFELGTALKGLGQAEGACSAFENARYGDFTEPANHELEFQLKCEGHAGR
jgi:tetratricopeptide (TPR) repeat protein